MLQLINIPKMAYILFRPHPSGCWEIIAKRTVHLLTQTPWRISNDRAGSSLSPAAWGHMPGKIGPCLANNLTSYPHRLLTSQQIKPTSVMSCSKIWNLLELLKFVFNHQLWTQWMLTEIQKGGIWNNLQAATMCIHKTWLAIELAWC